MFARKGVFSSIGRGAVMATVAAIAISAVEPSPASSGPGLRLQPPVPAPTTMIPTAITAARPSPITALPPTIMAAAPATIMAAARIAITTVGPTMAATTPANTGRARAGK